MVDLRQVIEFFNDAAADLPDHARLKGRKLPSMTAILDGKGANFADVFEPSNRRIWVSLDDIPGSVQKAFVAAEDRRFYQHHGVDERGIIRAFMGNLGESGRPQGGSTITQQVVKNLLVGEDVTYERKIRETTQNRFRPGEMKHQLTAPRSGCSSPCVCHRHHQTDRPISDWAAIRRIASVPAAPLRLR